LRRGGLDEAAAGRALEAIDRNAQVQTRLIADILDVSGIVAGQLSLDVAPVDLASVIRVAVETATPGAEAKGVHLHASLEEEVGHVRGDAERLRQVVWNLLSSAIRATARGGDVSVRLTRVGETARVSVGEKASPGRPTGTGQTSDPSTPAGGGVGLAIVRHLVELHGGVVEPGAGAACELRLPLLPRRGTAPPPSESLSDALPDLSGVRVLVVEDEDDSREVVARILEQRGATVTSVGSAAAAFEALQQRPPDVILSDIGMPGEDGYTLMRRIRSLPTERGGQVPAAAFTAFARSDDRMKALLSGFQLHIPKPIQPDELVAVVCTLAGRNMPPLESTPRS
jgi:CheY-like chemotaxis protein